jgi:zinc protease
MKLSKLLFLSLTVASFFGTAACNQGGNSDASSTNPDELKIDYEKYSLDNGLDVILHKDDSDPIVSIAIMFHVGSNREKPGRTGFAHFFEHMLFQNSENVGKGNFFKIIEEMGGDFNGGTWNDGTVYYEVVPKDALEQILWMESDRMGFMINTVTEAVFQNEKQIVKNEKRHRVDNQPYGHTGYVIGKALYPEGHPYNWQVIGSLEDLDAATLDDVKDFYNQWYGPNNATMVVAGDIDMAGAKAMIEKYFAEIPAKAEVPHPERQPIALDNTIKLMHEDNFAQLPELRLVWPSVEDGHPDMYALNYLGELLSQGKRAPLFKEVVENQKLAPSTAAYNSEREITGEFYVRARANAGTDLDDLHAAIFKAFEDFETNGIDPRDMERIKNTQETDFYNGISSLLNKSFQLVQSNEFRGNPGDLTEEIKRILAVTEEDINRVYEKYIKGKNYLATSFVPKGMTDLALEGSQIAEVVEEPVVAGAEPLPMEEGNEAFEKTPSKIDRSTLPPLGEAPVVKTPTIWNSKLSNGLEVYGIQNAELPLVEFSLRLKGGMLMDDITKVGVANLMTDIMMEGTQNKTPEELQDAIGQLGANIYMRTAPEYITINGSCLSRNYEAVLTLMEEMLLEPRWDQKEFDRVKKSTITQIQQRAGNPNQIAANCFNKLIYGKDNILANSTIGTKESVESITIDDLKNFYAANYSPSVSSFHLVGAVDKERTLKGLKSLEEKWATKEVVIPTPAAPQPVEKSNVYFVDIPGSKQSVIRIGAPAMKGGDDDYYAATVVNQRLGVGTSGRFFQQLREEKGYTYGAYSGISRRINNGVFVATSSVRSNVSKESAILFKEIMEGYQEDYSAEDLEKTKSMLIKGSALSYETLNDKMGILQNITTFGLSKDYPAKEQKILMDLTLEKAKELIGSQLISKNMIYMVIGDAATQAEGMKDVGFGEPIMLDKEGEVIDNIAN